MSLVLITLLAASILSAASAHELDTAAVDSSTVAAMRDSLRALKTARAVQGLEDSLPRMPFSVGERAIFASDHLDPSEITGITPLTIPIRFSLSNRLSRFLPYGNTAPLLELYPQDGLLPVSLDPYRGTDDVSLVEISGLRLEPNNVCRYDPYPLASVEPEAALYWENGVFDENIFALRFMRPLSSRLTMNAFSHYRYFKGTAFTHQRNDVYSFYRSFTADSSTIVDRGYNPLSNDFTSGVRLLWRSPEGGSLFGSLRYADCADELAIDRGTGSAMTTAGQSWMRLNQYRTTLDVGGIGFGRGVFFGDWQGRFEEVVLRRSSPEQTATQLTERGTSRVAAGAVRGGTTVFGDDTLALVYRARWTRRKPFDRAEGRSLLHAPELVAAAPFSSGEFKGELGGALGYSHFTNDDSIDDAPHWSVTASGEFGGQVVRLYAKQGVLPLSIPFDSASFLDAPLLDRHRVAGGEIALSANRFSLMLGCQSIEGIEESSVAAVWPGGLPPYAQPRLVFLTAPSVGPWHGFSLSSRTLISDRKPFIKSGGMFTAVFRPANIPESFNMRLGIDYWSERDPVVFAGINGWHRPVLNLYTDLAVHIASFRFFAKIDNLLNRRFAYVPGYFSPGLTFRWGISWFLQK